MRRNADYSILEIFEKFDAFKPMHDQTNGNIGMRKELSWFKDAVNSPMLLARLVSAGVPIIVLGQDGYKITWETQLVHIKSGGVITFYDYKGGVSFGSNGELSDEFLNDVHTLLKALSNERFPHPYDGCVVGEEA